MFQDDFTAEDFASMSAPLLYKMLCSKCEFPLHAAVSLKREDIVFLYLIEFDAQVKAMPIFDRPGVYVQWYLFF